jgi:hypothetical protein
MSKQKHLFPFLIVAAFIFGTMLFSPNAVRAQTSSLWRPNPAAMALRNRIKRMNRGKKASAKRSGATTSRRRSIRSRRRN